MWISKGRLLAMPLCVHELKKIAVSDYASILGLGRLRQHHRFEASLSYKALAKKPRKPYTKA